MLPAFGGFALSFGVVVDVRVAFCHRGWLPFLRMACRLFLPSRLVTGRGRRLVVVIVIVVTRIGILTSLLATGLGRRLIVVLVIVVTRIVFLPSLLVTGLGRRLIVVLVIVVVVTRIRIVLLRTFVRQEGFFLVIEVVVFGGLGLSEHAFGLSETCVNVT
jgi:hypothetical protein